MKEGGGKAPMWLGLQRLINQNIKYFELQMVDWIYNLHDV
jgi:hypothetical protein